MKKKLNSRKGFTLAELLIVVAIIAVLVAIAIPAFTSQLERSKEATDLANVRSAYATVVTQYMADGESTSVLVSAKQGKTGWQYENGSLEIMDESGMREITVPDKKKGESFKVSIDDNGSVNLS